MFFIKKIPTLSCGFALSFIEFAFYVNKSGQRTRNDFMVFWEGQPTGFGMDVYV